LHLLCEREGCVDHDHDHDGYGDSRDSRNPGKARGGPEKKRERMRELLKQLGRPAPSATALQDVQAILDQAALGLARRKTGLRGAQVSQQEVDTFGWVDGTGRGCLAFAHADAMDAVMP
jgi:hypothetical protein